MPFRFVGGSKMRVHPLLEHRTRYEVGRTAGLGERVCAKQERASGAGSGAEAVRHRAQLVFNGLLATGKEQRNVRRVGQRGVSGGGGSGTSGRQEAKRRTEGTQLG